jgi:hypothetical protein
MASRNVVVALLAVAGLSRHVSGVKYNVTYTTGSHTEAGSKAPMYIQLQGVMGSSPYMELGSEFARDSTATVQLEVPYDVGSLVGIQIKADTAPPYDSWNAVNFIDILEPSGAIAQFQTDFTLSGQPQLKQTDFGLYEAVSAVYSNRLNHAMHLATAKVYEVVWQTGSKPDAGSDSHHFLQLVGTRANSRFYDLCKPGKAKCFSRGLREAISVSVNEDIGLLRGVKFMAGGSDGWNVVDFVEVGTPSSQTIQFPANFWLDSKTHLKKPAAYGIYPYDKSRTLMAINLEVQGVLRQAEQCPMWSGLLSSEAGSAVCCPRYCGRCGGSNCAYQMGGAKDCCHRNVKLANNPCTVHAAPCVVNSDEYGYRLSIATGSLLHAGTTGRVFVQIVGQRGRTNFQLISSSAMNQPGKRFQVRIVTPYNLGDVTGITLKSSSEDGWYVDGDIIIMGAKFKYKTSSGYWIDMQPNTNSEDYQGKPHAASHTFYGLLRESYAARVNLHFGGAGSGKFTGTRPQLHNGAATGIGNATAEGPIFAATRMVTGQSKGQRWCQLGKLKVAEGWWGNGYGDNFCNRCKCDVNPTGDALLTCTKKSCGVYWRNTFIKHGAVCAKSDLECKFGNDRGNKLGNAEAKCAKLTSMGACKAPCLWSKGQCQTPHAAHRVQVFHHTTGVSKWTKHRCGYDLQHPTKPCTCVCFDPIAEKHSRYVHGGTFNITFDAATAARGVACRWIKFPKPFERGSLGETFATVAVSATNRMQDRWSMPWVQATNERQFQACVDAQATDGLVDVEMAYVAYDQRHSGTRHLRTGQVNFYGGRKHHTDCYPVWFKPAFPGAAGATFIAGSVDMFSDAFEKQKEGIPVFHWITDVRNDRFTTCVRRTSDIDDGAYVRFNYLAARDTVAQKTWLKPPLYSEASSIDFGEFTDIRCESHKFRRTHSAVPTVLVTAEATFNAGDVETLNKRPINAYLTEVSKTGFTACVQATIKDTSLARSAKLHWVAVGDDVAQVTTAAKKATTEL